MPDAELVAMGGFSMIGTVVFFVPAAVLVALVVGGVVRDRRLSAREAAEEAARDGMARESIPDRDGSTRPRAD